MSPNHHGQAFHRTMLSAGFLDELNADQLNAIQKTITAKVANVDKALFELPYSDDLVVLDYVVLYFNRMVIEKRIDIPSDEVKSKVSRLPH